MKKPHLSLFIIFSYYLKFGERDKEGEKGWGLIKKWEISLQKVELFKTLCNKLIKEVSLWKLYE